jgi:hypothetical protein
VSDATIYKGCSKYGGMDVSEAKQMNRTIRDAAIKRFHYDSLEQLRRHLQDSIGAHTFGRRQRTLKNLTSHEFICKRWAYNRIDAFLDPIQQMSGLNRLRRDDRSLTTP